MGKTRREGSCLQRSQNNYVLTQRQVPAQLRVGGEAVWLCEQGGANPGFSPALHVTLLFLHPGLPREPQGGDGYHGKLLKEIKCHSSGVSSPKRGRN